MQGWLSTINDLMGGVSVALDVSDCLDTAQAKVEALVRMHPCEVPVCTRQGRWEFAADPWAPAWTAGFLAGELWIFAERTSDSWWLRQAKLYSMSLEPRKIDTGTHDIGFLFSPSWGRWHAFDPGDRTRAVLIQAGRTMAKRYNAVGRYLSTWVDPACTFVDVMMNIGVIFHAAELCGDRALADIACQHALTTRRFLVRGDATTAHEGWFDLTTGEFLHTGTSQGYRGDSCWSRGLAWSIYGFATAYRYTRDDRFLETSCALARTYMTRVGVRFVPPNDLDDPQPSLPYESSAASIAAAALLELSTLADDCDVKRVCKRYAEAVLQTLSSPPFIARRNDPWEGIIKHAAYHQRERVGVDESVMWGDYYYIEALWKLARANRRNAGSVAGSRELT